MVNICLGDILVEIWIRIYSNDQPDILYNTSYHQHQLVNYRSPLDMLFIRLAGQPWPLVSVECESPLSPYL